MHVACKHNFIARGVLLAFVSVPRAGLPSLHALKCDVCNCHTAFMHACITLIKF